MESNKCITKTNN